MNKFCSFHSAPNVLFVLFLLFLRLELLDLRFDESIPDLLERWEVPLEVCLLYTSPSPRDLSTSRMPSSA